jgi:hypothetical protein
MRLVLGLVALVALAGLGGLAAYDYVTGNVGIIPVGHSCGGRCPSESSCCPASASETAGDCCTDGCPACTGASGASAADCPACPGCPASKADVIAKEAPAKETPAKETPEGD